MSIIKFATEDQLLILVQSMPVITAGNRNYDKIQVNFDNSWNCKEGTLYAAFYIDDSENAIDVQLKQVKDSWYSCTVPDEMVATEGGFYVGVWQKTESRTKTSSVKFVPVLKGLNTDCDEVEEETKPDGVNTSVYLTEAATGTRYELKVIDGKLTMQEVQPE